MNNRHRSTALRISIAVLLAAVTVGSQLTIGPKSTDRRGDRTATASAFRPAELADTGAEVQPDSERALLKQAARTEPSSPPVIVFEEYVPPPPSAPVVARTVPNSAPRSAAPTAAVTIPVPVYRQLRVLNCETAALQMGLAYYGHYYSQDALFAYENPDLRAPVMGPNHTVAQWGDPYVKFVGNVNGSDYTPTGYGVYYPVILSIARTHGVPNAYGGEGFAASTIYGELSARHPVQVWVEAKWLRPRLGTWTAWDGRRIRYSLAEHSVTLTGVSATMVRVNDDLFGTQYWVSKATFEASWRDFNNMAVIFR